MAPGVTLKGAVIGGGEYRPAKTVRGLLWQRETGFGDFQPELRLEQDYCLLAINDDPPVQGRYSAESWREGEQIREVRDLRLPAGSDGQVDVVLQSGELSIPLGTIEVAG
ncbi:MAG: hypothetical protein R3C44_05185 [Chloroflexota bacterium]